MAVTLDARTFLTPNQLRRRMRSQDVDIRREDEIVDALNESSSICRELAQRRLLFLGTDYIEFHNIYHREETIFLRERPINSITTVHEDDQRVYGAGDLLTEDDDFILDKNKGTLTRVSGTDVWRWERGLRTIRVEYDGGYDDVATDKANVPEGLKRACAKLALLILREDDRVMQGVSSKTDSAGSVTRFAGRIISEDVLMLLRPYRIRGYTTWVTDEVVA